MFSSPLGTSERPGRFRLEGIGDPPNGFQRRHLGRALQRAEVGAVKLAEVRLVDPTPTIRHFAIMRGD